MQNVSDLLKISTFVKLSTSLKSSPAPTGFAKSQCRHNHKFYLRHLIIQIRKLRWTHTNCILLLFSLKNLSVSALYYPASGPSSRTFWKGLCMLLAKHAVVLQSKLLYCRSYKYSPIPTSKYKFKFNFHIIILSITLYLSIVLISYALFKYLSLLCLKYVYLARRQLAVCICLYYQHRNQKGLLYLALN